MSPGTVRQYMSPFAKTSSLIAHGSAGPSNRASMKNFALIGAAGYVAPKHLQAISATGNRLIVASDRHDSVGVLDRYFPSASFFTEYERFDRFLELQRREGGDAVDYLTICTPNYLHDAHCRLALRVGADAICEKPLVIAPWNLDQLRELEQQHGRKIYNVLQLRLHPVVQKIRRQVATSCSNRRDIELTYITRRGRWYHHSWKGDVERSGGLPMNIGVHFFDFLLWIFGRVERNTVHVSQPGRAAGLIELENASVRWFLSIDESDLPAEVRESGGFAYRSLKLDDEEIDLSAGFTDLHTAVYEDILSGGGYGIEDAKAAIELIYQIRTSQTVSPSGRAHHLVKSPGSVLV